MRSFHYQPLINFKRTFYGLCHGFTSSVDNCIKNFHMNLQWALDHRADSIGNLILNCFPGLPLYIHVPCAHFHIFLGNQRHLKRSKHLRYGHGILFAKQFIILALHEGFCFYRSTQRSMEMVLEPARLCLLLRECSTFWGWRVLLWGLLISPPRFPRKTLSMPLRVLATCSWYSTVFLSSCTRSSCRQTITSWGRQSNFIITSAHYLLSSKIVFGRRRQTSFVHTLPITGKHRTMEHSYHRASLQIDKRQENKNEEVLQQMKLNTEQVVNLRNNSTKWFR